MPKFRLLLLIFALVAKLQIVCSASVKSGIFGGSPAGQLKTVKGKVTMLNNGEFPYMASIETRVNNAHKCGAAIIRLNVALTSAHCTEGKTAADLQLRAGTYVRSDTKSETFQVQPVKRILPHPNHRNPTNHDYDLAIIWLSDNLRVTKYVNAIRMAIDFEVGEETIILGYGWDENHENQKRLKKASLTTISNKRCNNLLKSKSTQATSSMVCSISPTRDVVGCSGDSGGPQVLQNWVHPEKSVLVGLISWCVMDEKKVKVRNTFVTYNTCSTQYPTMSANIAFIRDWILTQIETKPKPKKTMKKRI